MIASLFESPAAIDYRAARKLADAAGGWSSLREKSEAYGEPGKLVALAYDIAEGILREGVDERSPLAHPAAVASLLALRFGCTDQEVLGVIFLDSRHRMIGQPVEIARGTINRVAIEPRQILREAILASAAGFVVFHNHPSGDPTPSAEDLSFSRRLADAGRTIGVEMVDSIILGAIGRWTSLRERGL